MELLGTSAGAVFLCSLIFAWRGMFHWNLLVYG